MAKADWFTILILLLMLPFQNIYISPVNDKWYKWDPCSCICPQLS